MHSVSHWLKNFAGHYSFDFFFSVARKLAVYEVRLIGVQGLEQERVITLAQLSIFTSPRNGPLEQCIEFLENV